MPFVAALVGAFAISFSAVWFELADVSAVTGAFFRVAYALPVLWLLWMRVRHKDPRSHKARWLAAAAGAMLAGDFISWHVAIEQIGTGLATLIANTQVAFVGLLAWMLFGEKPARIVMVSIPVVLTGLALVTGLGREGSFGANPVLGAVLGFAAALFYAGFLLGYRRSNRVQGPAVGSLLDASAGAAVTTLLVAPFLGNLDIVPSWPAHGWLLALALGSQVVGWLGIGYALPRLPAAETSTFILIQPVLTMIWGAILFAERPSGLQLTGAAIVLFGVGMVAVFTQRRKTPLPASA